MKFARVPAVGSIWRCNRWGRCVFHPIVIAALAGVAVMFVLNRYRDADGDLRIGPVFLGLILIAGAALAALVGLEAIDAWASEVAASVARAQAGAPELTSGLSALFFVNVAALAALAITGLIFAMVSRGTAPRAYVLLGLVAVNAACLWYGPQDVAQVVGW